MASVQRLAHGSVATIGLEVVYIVEELLLGCAEPVSD
jgi:hypothetical protein